MQPNNTIDHSQKQESFNLAIKKDLRNISQLGCSSAELSEIIPKQYMNNNSPKLLPENHILGQNILDEPLTTYSLRNPSKNASNHQIIEVSKESVLKTKYFDRKSLSIQQAQTKKQNFKDLIAKPEAQVKFDGNHEEFMERSKSENKKTEETNKPNMVNTHNPYKITLNLWEYICSFLYKSDLLKKKLELINKGIKNINHRLDVVNILKKFRELDKLKALTLDHDQLMLFNNIPKPEIFPNVYVCVNKRTSFSRTAVKKLTFVQSPGTNEQIVNSFQNIKLRKLLTNIDERLIEIFEESDS